MAVILNGYLLFLKQLMSLGAATDVKFILNHKCVINKITAINGYEDFPIKFSSICGLQSLVNLFNKQCVWLRLTCINRLQVIWDLSNFGIAVYLT